VDKRFQTLGTLLSYYLKLRGVVVVGIVVQLPWTCLVWALMARAFLYVGNGHVSPNSDINSMPDPE
jgi:hypothetical protein